MFSNPSGRGGKSAALHGRTLTLIDDTTNVIANSSVIKLGNTTVNTAITIPSSAQYSGSYFLHANGTWATAGGGGAANRIYQMWTANDSVNTTFTVSGGYNIGFLDVYYNGLHLSNSDYTATNGTTVTLTTPGLNGAIIEVLGFSNASITQYAAGGANTQVQFNDSSTANGSAGFVFDKTTNVVTIANTILVSGTSLTANSANVVAAPSGRIVFNPGDAFRLFKSGASPQYIIERTDTHGDAINITSIDLYGRDSGAASERYVSIIGKSILDNATAEEGALLVDTVVAGSIATRMTVGNGVIIGAGTTLPGNGNISVGNTIMLGTTVLANTLGVYPASNTVGQLFGNTLARWVITGNSVTLSDTLSVTGVTTLAGQIANSLGIYPTSNTVGNIYGNTIARPVIVANSVTLSTTLGVSGATTLAGQTANSIGFYPTSNTAGQLFGNSISRWDLFTTGQTTNSLGIYPVSNTVGNIYGNTISRPVIVANSVSVSASVTTPNTGLVTATTASANGSTYLTGGILMNWGWVSANTSVGNATFPTAFPATCFSVQTCSVNALTTETTRTATYLTAAANTTVAIIRTANATVSTNVAYIAIGN